MVVFCPKCGGIAEEESSRGHLVCTDCGDVLEESVLKSEVTFTERSSGNATADGFIVRADQARAKSRGIFGTVRQGGVESREQTIQNGKRRIQQLASTIKLLERHVDIAVRTFTLAINHNFTKGRRSQVVVAACVYMVCRLEKLPHMLIDFAEIIQTNVYVLGATFLQLARKLDVILPNIDPSIYLLRFADRLDFGDKAKAVATDATKLVSRMNYDWITLGRRPSGVCAACLFIAARMHGFRRTHREIVAVVKICETTLRKRLNEFKETESGSMSVRDFQTMGSYVTDSGGKWEGRQFGPPSLLLKGKRKSKLVSQLQAASPPPSADMKDAQDENREDGTSEVDEDEDIPFTPARGKTQQSSSTKRLIDDDMDEIDLNIEEPLAKGADADEEMEEADIMEEMKKALQNPEFQQHCTDMDDGDDSSPEENGEYSSKQKFSDMQIDSIDQSSLTLVQIKLAKTQGVIPTTIQQPVTTILPSPVGIVIKNVSLNGGPSSPAVDGITVAVMEETEEDWATLDDDDEVANVLLTEEEIELKTRLWEEENKDWEEKQARKRILEQANGRDGETKKPRRNKKDKDAAAKNQPAASAAEAAKNLLATKKTLSKKINHEVLQKLFETPQ